MFLPNNLQKSWDNPHVLCWCIRLKTKKSLNIETDKSLNISLGHLRSKVEVNVFGILAGARTPLHMHSITSCTFCFLFALLLLSLLLDCLFPSLICLAEEVTSAAGCLNISTQGKQLKSSINDFYIPCTSTSLILLPHTGYMTHSTALQVLRLPNNSYNTTTCQFYEVSALLQQLKVKKG